MASNSVSKEDVDSRVVSNYWQVARVIDHRKNKSRGGKFESQR